MSDSLEQHILKQNYHLIDLNIRESMPSRFRDKFFACQTFTFKLFLCMYIILCISMPLQLI